jgi:hypothetical protein
MTETVTTEIATRVESAVDLLVKQYPALRPDEETIELLEEIYGGQPGIRDLGRIKFPTSGMTSWVVDNAGEETMVKELVGVPLMIRRQRSFWTDINPTGAPPECASLDGKTPLPGGLYAPDGANAAKNPKGTCAACPMAQWGSSVKNDRGQWCRDQRALFLFYALPEKKALLPTLILVPPSSIRILDDFIKGLLGTQTLPFFKTVMGFALEKATSADGQDYALLKPRLVRELDADEAAEISAYRADLRRWVAEEPPMTFMTETADTRIDLTEED